MSELEKQKAISITIDVLSSNEAAKKLYENAGFVFHPSEQIRPGVIQGIYQCITQHSTNYLINIV